MWILGGLALRESHEACVATVWFLKELFLSEGKIAIVYKKWNASMQTSMTYTCSYTVTENTFICRQMRMHLDFSDSNRHLESQGRRSTCFSFNQLCRSLSDSTNFCKVSFHWSLSSTDKWRSLWKSCWASFSKSLLSRMLREIFLCWNTKKVRTNFQVKNIL